MTPTEELSDFSSSQIRASMSYIAAPNVKQLAHDISSYFPYGTRLIITELSTETAKNAKLIEESDIRYYNIFYFRPPAHANQRTTVYLSMVKDIRTAIPVYPVPPALMRRVDVVLDDPCANFQLPWDWELRKINPEKNPVRKKTVMFNTGITLNGVAGEGSSDGAGGGSASWTPAHMNIAKPPDRLIEMTNPQLERNMRTEAYNVRISLDGRIPFLPIFVDCSLRDAAQRAREFVDISFRYLVQLMRSLEHYHSERHLVDEINRIFPLRQELSTMRKDLSCSRNPVTSSSSSSSSAGSKSSKAKNFKSAGFVNNNSSMNNSNSLSSSQAFASLHAKFKRLPIFCILVVDDAWYWVAACWREQTCLIKLLTPRLGAIWKDENDGLDVKNWVGKQIGRFGALVVSYYAELNDKIWELWPRDEDVLDIMRAESASEKLFKGLRGQTIWKGVEETVMLDMGEDHNVKNKEQDRTRNEDLSPDDGEYKDSSRSSFDYDFESEGEKETIPDAGDELA